MHDIVHAIWHAYSRCLPSTEGWGREGKDIIVGERALVSTAVPTLEDTLIKRFELRTGVRCIACNVTLHLELGGSRRPKSGWVPTVPALRSKPEISAMH
jgi:hypothetical protein